MDGEQLKDLPSEEVSTKMEKDYSSVVDAKLPELQALAKDGKVGEAVEQLLALEKQTRTAGDALSTGRVLVCVVDICWEARDHDQLNEQVVFLTKRRGQLKQAVTKMVQRACEFVDEIADMPLKLRLIDTLRTVTAGKIYVEIERARLTLKLAKIKEEGGEVKEAAEVLQELQVETFGSMERREKIEFILEQMRLCVAIADFVRAQIISKKISLRVFNDDKFEDLKLRFYQLMIVLAEHDDKHLEVCKHWRAIYDTPSVQADASKWHEALANAVMFLCLSPHGEETADLTHRVFADKRLKQMPGPYHRLLEQFITLELMRWGASEQAFGPALRATAVFKAGADSKGDARWEELRKRVVEHNIRVISTYYTEITTQRLCQLLELERPEAERFLSALVVNKTIFAKVDRPAGIVRFKPPQSPSQVLDSWSRNLDALMSHVTRVGYLISKEEMVHTAAKSGKAK